jgi:uncharacterized FlaG/YvyC family protein
MSTDFSIRPAGAPVATPIVQVASSAANNAVATELPPSQSVTAAAAGARTELQSASDFTSRQAFFDSAAASVVFQVVDSRTDEVVRQFPDEAVLRRRAYFHTLDLTKNAPTRLLATDRTA